MSWDSSKREMPLQAVVMKERLIEEVKLECDLGVDFLRNRKECITDDFFFKKKKQLLIYGEGIIENTFRGLQNV